MRNWQVLALAGLFVAAVVTVIPAERDARRLRKEERKAAWRAHWEKVRPRAWHELPIIESPSIVTALPQLQLGKS